MIAARRQDVVRLLVLASTTAALVLCMSVVVVAQSSAQEATATVTTKDTRSETAEAQGERNEHFQKMAQRLKLTDDQAVKVKAIMQAQWAESRELRSKHEGQSATSENKAAMKNARKELHASTDAKLAQVLTTTQMTEFKKMRAEHRKHKESGKEEKGEAKEGK